MFKTTIAVLVVGIIQGLTEFLPVSSSGHLTLFQYFSKDFNSDLSINIAVHMGTLLTVLIFYRQDLIEIVSGVLRRQPEACAVIGEIIVASIPTAVIGFLIKYSAEEILTDPVVSVIGLLFTGAMLLYSSRFKSKCQTSSMTIGYKAAFLIGVMQGIGVLPGVSRSGATIVMGLSLGLSPTKAAQFSFLISIPAVAGAGLLESLSDRSEVVVGNLILGAIVSFLAGLVAISWMVRLTQKGQLNQFGYYTITVSFLFFAFYFFEIGKNVF